MKKKIVLSSAIIVLLMLASLQTVFMNTAASDPTMHAGDADIGDLWISELVFVNESSTITEIDNVSIAHVNASDDWVLWEDRTGNVTADWDINIGDDHPEYHVIFNFAIYDVRDNNTEIGNTSYETTLNLNTSYTTSGTLSVALDLSYVPQPEKTRTLVCFLGAYVRVNNTNYDAVNFTSIASDRSVVGVDFEDPPMQPPFSGYRDEANAAFPHHWAWVPGWNEARRFANEKEMLNTQTAFAVGNDNLPAQQQYNHTWYMGNVTVRIPPVDWWKLIKVSYVTDELIRDWSLGDDDNVAGCVNINYTIQDPRDIAEGWVPIKFYIRLTATEPTPDETIARKLHRWYYDNNPSGIGDFLFGVTADNSSRGSDDYINVGGRLWAWTIIPVTWSLNGRGYKIHINESIDQDIPNVDTYYWEASVTYTNDTSSSFSVSSSEQSGITTVQVDIQQVLKSENEYIETFSAERGNMRVKFTCGG